MQGLLKWTQPPCHPPTPHTPANAIFTATIFTAKESPQQLSLSVYWLRHRREMSLVSSPALRVPTRLRGGTKFNPIPAPCQMVVLDVLFILFFLQFFLGLCRPVKQTGQTISLSDCHNCKHDLMLPGDKKHRHESEFETSGQTLPKCPFVHFVHAFDPRNMYN